MTTLSVEVQKYIRLKVKQTTQIKTSHMVHNTVPKKRQVGLQQYVIPCKNRFEVLGQFEGIISTSADQCVDTSPKAPSLKASDHGKAPNKIKKKRVRHLTLTSPHVLG